MERNETPRGPGWKGLNTNDGQQSDFPQNMKGDVEVSNSPLEKEDKKQRDHKDEKHSEEKNSDEDVQIGQWED